MLKLTTPIIFPDLNKFWSFLLVFCEKCVNFVLVSKNHLSGLFQQLKKAKHSIFSLVFYGTKNKLIWLLQVGLALASPTCMDMLCASRTCRVQVGLAVTFTAWETFFMCFITFLTILSKKNFFSLQVRLAKMQVICQPWSRHVILLFAQILKNS